MTIGLVLVFGGMVYEVVDENYYHIVDDRPVKLYVGGKKKKGNKEKIDLLSLEA